MRLFYFVFAVLLYNIWRLTDFLLKATVDGEMEYAPVPTAGEAVGLISAGLTPVEESVFGGFGSSSVRVATLF